MDDMTSQQHEHSSQTNVSHMPIIECDGTLNPNPGGGTWQGHIIPGAVLILWGCWWTISIIISHLTSSPTRPYRAKTWWPVHFPRQLRFAEPALKIFLPLLAMSIELYFDHPEGFQHLYCPSGTKRAGYFAENNINNWQHTATYPAFVLSGMIDIIGEVVPLPPGTGQGVLAFAFSLMAFLMGVHEKHEALDKMVHWLMFVAMVASTLAIVIEMRFPKNTAMSLTRAAAVILLGAWTVQVGKIEFEGHPEWAPGGMAAPMLAPVFFTAIAVMVVSSILVVYVVLYMLKQQGLVKWLFTDAQHAAKEYASIISMNQLQIEMQNMDEFEGDSANDSPRGAMMPTSRGGQNSQWREEKNRMMMDENV